MKQNKKTETNAFSCGRGCFFFLFFFPEKMKERVRKYGLGRKRQDCEIDKRKIKGLKTWRENKAEVSWGLEFGKSCGLSPSLQLLPPAYPRAWL